MDAPAELDGSSTASGLQLQQQQQQLQEAVPAPAAEEPVPAQDTQQQQQQPSSYGPPPPAAAAPVAEAAVHSSRSVSMDSEPAGSAAAAAAAAAAGSASAKEAQLTKLVETLRKRLDTVKAENQQLEDMLHAAEQRSAAELQRAHAAAAEVAAMQQAQDTIVASAAANAAAQDARIGRLQQDLDASARQVAALQGALEAIQEQHQQVLTSKDSIEGGALEGEHCWPCQHVVLSVLVMDSSSDVMVGSCMAGALVNMAAAAATGIYVLHCNCVVVQQAVTAPAYCCYAAKHRVLPACAILLAFNQLLESGLHLHVLLTCCPTMLLLYLLHPQRCVLSCQLLRASLMLSARRMRRPRQQQQRGRGTWKGS
jgi:chemotaxis protein histidine kinase CheA